MGHKKRQKLDRTSIAAYAANQPLLSALKHATKSIGEQSTHLANARDTSQSLHVNIINGNGERHEEYMDSITRAYRLSVESYCAIFAELVSITAAEPSEGREAGRRHEEFAALLATVERAKSAVEEYEHSKKPVGNDEDETSDEASGRGEVLKDPIFDKGDDEISQEPATERNASGKRPLVAVESLPKPSGDRVMLNAKFRQNRSGDVIWMDGELQVPFASLNPDERKAWGIIQERRRRGKRRHKAEARKEEEEQLVGQNHADKVEDAELEVKAANQQPPVEYEDINDEVDQRLKAKAAKRDAEKAAKKAEKKKKRKRESGDSVVNPDVGQDVAENADFVAQDAKPEKPAKKKSRNALDAEADSQTKQTADAVTKPPVDGDPTTAAVKKSKTKKRNHIDAREETSQVPQVNQSSKSEKGKEIDADDGSVRSKAIKKRKKSVGL